MLRDEIQTAMPVACSKRNSLEYASKNECSNSWQLFTHPNQLDEQMALIRRMLKVTSTQWGIAPLGVSVNE